jgi:hypothetical protein
MYRQVLIVLDYQSLSFLSVHTEGCSAAQMQAIKEVTVSKSFLPLGQKLEDFVEIQS